MKIYMKIYIMKISVTEYGVQSMGEMSIVNPAGTRVSSAESQKGAIADQSLFHWEPEGRLIIVIDFVQR